MLIYISAVALFLSWLLPLHFPPWVSWHLELLAFVAVYLLAWSVILIPKLKAGLGAFRIPAVGLPFITLGLVAVVQFSTGVVTYGGDALVFVLYMVLCVMCLTLGFDCGAQTISFAGTDHAKKIDSALVLLAGVVLVGAFASAVLAFAQVLDVWEATWINRTHQLRRPGANLGQPNHLATLLLMGVASLLFLYELGRLKALSSILIFIVLGMALAFTESRTGVLSFLLLAGWWFVKNKRVGFKSSHWTISLAFIVFLAIFWTWPSIFAFIQKIGTSAEVNVKAGSRLMVWPQLFEAVTQRPWLGWGLGNVPEAHNAVVHAYLVSEPFSYSHNILLDLALGIGVPITVILVLLTGWWLWTRLMQANQLRSWYCLAVSLPLAVHSLFEFPFAYAYFLVPVMFALGILEGMSKGKVAFQIGLRLAIAIFFGVNIIAAWSAIEYFRIEEDFRIARFEGLKLGQTPTDYERPKVVILTQLGALLDGARIAPKPDMTANELELAKKVAMRYPWTATQNRYALSLALNGNPEEAIRQMRVIRALYGEKTYNTIKNNWKVLAEDKFPQLRGLELP
ncbi:PglL family O-oligosaccharyltransferase [Noviherbaspirillum sedimenti]|nr:O-antigen ligase family protein [Noviherbaspirillum sedimenti]